MTQDLAATNMWLAVIALVSLAEFLIIVAAAVAGFRLYRRANALIDRAESTYVAPLADRLNTVLGEAQDVVRRVQRLEERGRAMLARVEGTASRVSSVAEYAWPVLGTWRAVSAAVSLLINGNHERTAPGPVTKAREFSVEPGARGMGPSDRSLKGA